MYRTSSAEACVQNAHWGVGRQQAAWSCTRKSWPFRRVVQPKNLWKMPQNFKHVQEISRKKKLVYLFWTSWTGEILFMIFKDLQGSSRFHRFHLVGSVSPATGRCKASHASSAKDVVLRRRSLVAAAKFWHLRLWWIVGAYSFAAQANMEPNRNFWQLPLYSRNDCVKFYGVV